MIDRLSAGSFRELGFFSRFSVCARVIFRYLLLTLAVLFFVGAFNGLVTTFFHFLVASYDGNLYPYTREGYLSNRLVIFDDLMRLDTKSWAYFFFFTASKFTNYCFSVVFFVYALSRFIRAGVKGPDLTAVFSDARPLSQSDAGDRLNLDYVLLRPQSPGRLIAKSALILALWALISFIVETLFFNYHLQSLSAFLSSLSMVYLADRLREKKPFKVWQAFIRPLFLLIRHFSVFSSFLILDIIFISIHALIPLPLGNIDMLHILSRTLVLALIRLYLDFLLSLTYLQAKIRAGSWSYAES